MKIAGIITEYNPFHNGHIEHINKTKEIANASHIVSVMSGSFVQRGEPAIVDKWTRAKTAVENGVDLVLELPVVYSVQSAELFAYGAINVLDSLNIVNSIVFGSESGNIDELTDISNVLLEETPLFKKDLKNSLKEGKSYAVSRSIAIEKELLRKNILDYKIKNLVRGSNNILGIEYIKALKKLDSKIVPLTYKRIGEHKSIGIDENIASATGIRHFIKENNLESLKNLLPENSYNNLLAFKNKYGKFNFLDNYSEIIAYILTITKKSELIKIFDVERGLENRILENSKEHLNIDKLISAIGSKRYPKTRISRILIHLLLRLTKEEILYIFSQKPKYIRILASNKKGFELINSIKDNSKIEIINKFSDVNRNIDRISKKMLSLEQTATDLYFLGLDLPKALKSMDYLTSPYIYK